jgi:predicted alpha/beta hydrolase family esterase
MSSPLVLLLPGWLNSGPTHWQSLWQAAHGYTRVEQHDWQRPLRGDWQARLDEVIANHLSAAQALTAPATAAAPIAPQTANNAAHHTTPSSALSKDELLAQQTRGLSANLASKTAPHSARSVAPSIVLVAHSLGCHLVAAWASASRHTAAVRGALLVAPPDVTRDDFPPDMVNWRKPVLQPLPFPSICVVSGNDPFASVQASQQTAAAWGARCVLLGNYGHINGESGLGDWPAGHALVQELVAASWFAHTP